MGKKLIIPGADFSANAIQIATFKTVNPNTSFQIKDSTVKNVQSDSNGIYEFDGYINYTGGTGAINLFNDSLNTVNEYIESIGNLRLRTNNLQYGFTKCRAVEEISISDIDFTGSVDVSYLFNECFALKKIAFPKTKIIRVGQSIDYMFKSVTLMETLDLSMLDTQDVNSMVSFFRDGSGGATSLRELNLSGWNLASFDTSVTASYNLAFYKANSLNKVIVNNCNASTIAKLQTILSTSGASFTQSTDSDGNTVLIRA